MTTESTCRHCGAINTWPDNWPYDAAADCTECRGLILHPVPASDAFQAGHLASVSGQLARLHPADVLDTDCLVEFVESVGPWIDAARKLTGLPQSDDLLACQRWRNNAEMIAALIDLYTRTDQIPAGPWVDLTFGKEGGWWLPKFNPAPPHLVCCIGPDTEGYDSVPMWQDDGEGRLLGPGWYRVDFRNAPFPDGQFALTCFDPPYVLKGGAGAYDSMNGRYGVGGERTTRDQLGALIATGLAEAVRITKRGGLIFAKGGSGIDGAKLFRTDSIIEQCADYDPNVEIVARLVFPTVPRSQVHRGKQQSVRNNYSTLIVCRKVAT